jgi:SpoVK/Ycf46/Vps4 family AAA+-type ATPase
LYIDLHPSPPFFCHLEGVVALVQNNVHNFTRDAINGFNAGVRAAQPITLPRVNLPEISVPLPLYQHLLGLSAVLMGTPKLIGYFFQKKLLEHQGKMLLKLNAKKILEQQEMIKRLFGQLGGLANNLASKGLYGALGAAGIAGTALAANSLGKGVSARMAESAAQKTAQIKAKAEIKLAKAKAKAEIRAEEGKVNARAQEAVKTIAERVKGTIEPVEIKREHSLDDIYGQVDAVKQANSLLLRIVNFERLKSLKANESERTFKPILMTGPPGTGKTETVRAIASMAKKKNVQVSPYIVNINKIPEDLAAHVMDEMRKLVRENTEKGIKTLFFMDEMDSIKAKPAIVNEILTLISGVNPLPDDVIIMGATNYPDILPPSVLSRFDQIAFNSANADIRKAIFTSQFNQQKLLPQNDVDMEKVARMTEGFNGRDINTVVENIRRSLVDQVLQDSSGAPPQAELPVSQAQLEAEVKKMRFKVDLIDAKSFDPASVLRRQTLPKAAPAA